MEIGCDLETDFSEITESAGQKATLEQVERLFHRYNFAREFARGKKVLEVACGSGLGLGYISEVAEKVVGGDINSVNIEKAREYYFGNPKVIIDRFDAHKLPYDNNSFNLVLFYEAIYYLKEPERFISEAARVLQDNGLLIIGTVNKDWADFHPSEYSHTYFSAPELRELLKGNFEHVQIYGAFEVNNHCMKSRTVSVLKRTASKLSLIPGSLKARAVLKRVFIGKLYPIPDGLHENMCYYREPVQLSDGAQTYKYKILYATARKS